MDLVSAELVREVGLLLSQRSERIPALLFIRETSDG